MRGSRSLFDGDVNIGTELVAQALHFGPRWYQHGYEEAHFFQSGSFDQISMHLKRFERRVDHVRHRR